MNVVQRVATKGWVVIDSEGTRFDLIEGQEYTTSPEAKDGRYVVFSNYWTTVPVECFEPQPSLAEQFKQQIKELWIAYLNRICP